MGNKQQVALLIIIFFAACTSKKYLVPDFEKIAATHKTIAILPFKVNYTGNIPSFLTFKDIEFINKKEGLAFQQSFYNEMCKKKGTLKNNVAIQAPTTTRERLKKLEGNTTTLSYADYCKILGVNAVVSGNISKPKLLTNLDTFGVYFPKDIKEKILASSTDLNDNIPQIPGNAARTITILVASTINNNIDNKELWNYKTNIEMEWKSSNIDIVNRVSEQLAKNFPY